MASLTPPPDGNQNRAPNLLGMIFAPLPVIYGVLFARLYVRFKRQALGVDDYLMFLAGAILTATKPFEVKWLRYGGAKHIYYIEPADLPGLTKNNLISQTMGAFQTLTAKTSVGFLVLRLFGPQTKWRRWIIWVMMAVFFLSTIAVPITEFGRCSPAQAVWKEIPGASCWKGGEAIGIKTGLAQSVIGMVVDFMLASIPSTIVWDLQKPKAEKIALCILLGLGIMKTKCIIAAVKVAVMAESLHWTDPTWQSFSLYILALLEIYLIIILGSIPSIRPLYDRVRKGKPISQTGISDKSRSNASKGGSFSLRYLLRSNRHNSRLGSISSRDDREPFAGDGVSGTRIVHSSNDEADKTLCGNLRPEGRNIVIQKGFDCESQQLPTRNTASDESPISSQDVF